MKKLRFIIALLGLSLLLCSCRSKDYYRHRMVRKAREYLLEERGDLSEIQRDYVRYATPDILNDRLIVRGDGKTKSSMDVMQSCVSWKVPDLEYPLMVVGVSERSMEYWYPIRVVEKKFVPHDRKRKKALENARAYAMNHMLFLSDEVRNRVRFVPPEIIQSDYKIDVSAKRLEKLKNPTQTAFVWSGDKSNRKVVVIGMGEASLARWKAADGLVESPEGIEKHTLKRLDEKRENQ